MSFEEPNKESRIETVTKRLNALRDRSVVEIVGNMKGPGSPDSIAEAAEGIFDELCKEAVAEYTEQTAMNREGSAVLAAVQQRLARDEHLTEGTARRLAATIIELEELIHAHETGEDEES